MLPSLHLRTARGREAILAGTLARFGGTDWPGPPAVHLDPSPGGDALTRITFAFRAALRAALAADAAPHLLLLEDDLAFHPRLAARVAGWEPLLTGALTAFASLYNPGVPALPAPGGETWFTADPARIYGAQALLLARPFAMRAVETWDALPGTEIQRLGALAACEQRPIQYHRPSLVQHVATVSSWGGPIHRAADFEES